MSARLSLRAGDNRLALAAMVEAGETVHSIVCDPPYGLTSITDRFGADGAAPAKHGTDGAFGRLSRGFMGQQWDGTGIERDPAFWRLVHDVLLPGGFCIAFSGSRTGHRQACAMEDAGFIMHPMVGWVFSSGFPKAKDVGKSDLDGADAMPGWKYGTQALKPALEPIYVAQRPGDPGPQIDSILRHGVGAINVDGCRVPSEGGARREGEASQDRQYNRTGSTDFAAIPGPRGGDPKGRHPANLLHDGSTEVVALFPASKGQAGAVRGTEPSRTGDENTVCYGAYSGVRSPAEPRGDEGSAARFFNAFPPDAGPVFYHPKATAKDRAGSRHPTVKPVALMRHLIRLVTPAGGTVLDPFAGSGTTGEAARQEGMACILMEANPPYVEFLRQRFNLDGAGDASIGGIFS